MDEEGWVFLQCRKWSGVTRHGRVVDTSEALKRLAEHPDVNDVSVFCVPSATASADSVVIAAVEPAVGVSLDLPELWAWCRDGLAAEERPDHLMVLAALPRTSAQKVCEADLRLAFSGGAQPVFPPFTEATAPN